MGSRLLVIFTERCTKNLTFWQQNQIWQSAARRRGNLSRSRNSQQAKRMPPGLVYEKTGQPCQIAQWEGVCSRAGVGATPEDGKLIAVNWSFRPRAHRPVCWPPDPLWHRADGAGEAILRYQLIRTKILREPVGRRSFDTCGTNIMSM
jgi:hypothetical protein